MDRKKPEEADKKIPSISGTDSKIVDHTSVESEAAYNGVSLVPIGGHGHGGEGH